MGQMAAHHGEAFQHAKGVMDGGEASQCASSAIAREWYDGLINVAWRETFALILASFKVLFPSVLIQRMEPLRRWAGRKPVASRSRPLVFGPLKNRFYYLKFIILSKRL